MANSVISLSEKWMDISSAFTVDATYCADFKAYTDGHQVYVKMIAKAGTPDQTNLVTNIPSQYRVISTMPVALSTFWMNWQDGSKGVAAYVMTSAIQVRTSGDIAGSGGVLVSGIYPIG